MQGQRKKKTLFLLLIMVTLNIIFKHSQWFVKNCRVLKMESNSIKITDTAAESLCQIRKKEWQMCIKETRKDKS